MLRLMVYCSTPMAKLIATIANQSGGRPGRKNSTADMFQDAMSQGWCQRKKKGIIRMKIKIPTTATVVKSNGLASR